MTQPPPKKSDLPTRVASAVVMVAVAGTALWLGGWWWTAFVAIVALGVLWEWKSLAFKIDQGALRRSAWAIAGAIYVGVAASVLIWLRWPYDGIVQVGCVLLSVIGVDVGAYFAGRTIGGPKIAPSISPSKTWAGFLGGAVGAGILVAAAMWAWPSGLCQAYFDATDAPIPAGLSFFDDRCHLEIPPLSTLLIMGSITGIIVAVVAQAGDFFESWMKRRAGVKDSSNLIPGHGGLFDRVDGLLAVSCLIGLHQAILSAVSL